MKIEEIIDDFMSRYEREYDFYQQVAYLCQQRCETLLAQKGIRAIVTFRAKRPDRLYPKIRQRAPDKNYTCVKDIYEDIVDLAAVRIALYFPGEDEEVDKLIRAEFTVNNSKLFPDPDKPDPNKKKFTYEKEFNGYKARHYHVYLKDEHLTDQRYSKARIEIQVASVLMHAWAEVEHDLLYKPLTGKPSEEEHAILDAINGLVLTGEIILERLQKAQEIRIGKKGSLFYDQYELATFLFNQFGTRTQGSTMIMGRADVLFRFLQLTQLDRPEKLTKYLSDLDTADTQQTISDQVLDHILASNSDLYEKYEKALLEVNVHHLNGSSEQALGYFLSRWIALETAIRFIAQYYGVELRHGLALTRQTIPIYMEIFKESKDTLGLYEWLRRFRNDLVHGANIPDNETLLLRGQSVEQLLNDLINSLPEEASTKIKAAKEIQRLTKTGDL